MANNKKISELPLAGTLTGYEVLPVVQDAETKSVTLDDVATYIGAASSSAFVGGFLYYPPANSAAPVSGDVREGMVGTELQLQEYNGATWGVRSTR